MEMELHNGERNRSNPNHLLWDQKLFCKTAPQISVLDIGKGH